MSGTAKEAERAQSLRKRAALGDKEAAAELQRGENTPDASVTKPRDPGTAGTPPTTP